jgi:hypothetical protein
MVDITKEDLTENELTGLGVFDHLMRSVKEHLLEEYSNQRIRDTDYANVYAGSINTTMQQAITFLLQEQQADAQADLTRANEALVREQIITEQKKQELLDCDILKCAEEIKLLQKQQLKLDAEITNLNFQNDLIVQQIEKMKSDIELTNAQIIGQGFINEKLAKDVIKADSEIALMEQQVINLNAELPKINAETALIQKQSLKADQEILNLIQEVEKSKQEVEVLQQNVINAQLAVVKMYADIEAAQKQAELIDAQVRKSEQEVLVMKERVYTEGAQTQDNPRAGVVGDGGAIGKKNLLFDAQREGYKRDAEQKVAKIYSDLWSVTRSTDNAINASYVLGKNRREELTPTQYVKQVVGIDTFLAVVRPFPSDDNNATDFDLQNWTDPSVHPQNSYKNLGNAQNNEVLEAHQEFFRLKNDPDQPTPFQEVVDPGEGYTKVQEVLYNLRKGIDNDAELP